MESIDTFVSQKRQQLVAVTKLSSEDNLLIDRRLHLESAIRREKKIIDSQPWRSLAFIKAKNKTFWLNYDYEGCRDQINGKLYQIHNAYRSIFAEAKEATERLSHEKGSLINAINGRENPMTSFYQRFVTLEHQARITLDSIVHVNETINYTHATHAGMVLTNSKDTEFKRGVNAVATGLNMAMPLAIIEGLGNAKLCMSNLERMATDLGVAIDNTNWTGINASWVTGTVAVRQVLQTTDFKKLATVTSVLNVAALESLRGDIDLMANAAYHIQEAALVPIRLYEGFEAQRSSEISSIKDQFANQLLSYAGSENVSSYIYVPEVRASSITSIYNTALRNLKGDEFPDNYPRVRHTVKNAIIALPIAFALAGAGVYYLLKEKTSQGIESPTRQMEPSPVK
jgi:hypothetical protein